MASYVYLKGKLSWVKVNQLNKYGKYTATIHPDHESMVKVNELIAGGIKNELKKDDDGQYYISFHRPPTIEVKGKLTPLPVPRLLNGEGQPINDLVGNGSDGILKLEVFKWKNRVGMSARLSAVRVDNLVPYTPEKDFTDEDRETVAGLKEQSKENW